MWACTMKEVPYQALKLRTKWYHRYYSMIMMTLYCTQKVIVYMQVNYDMTTSSLQTLTMTCTHVYASLQTVRGGELFAGSNECPFGELLSVADSSFSAACGVLAMRWRTRNRELLSTA